MSFQENLSPENLPSKENVTDGTTVFGITRICTSAFGFPFDLDFLRLKNNRVPVIPPNRRNMSPPKEEPTSASVAASCWHTRNDSQSPRINRECNVYLETRDFNFDLQILPRARTILFESIPHFSRGKTPPGRLRVLSRRASNASVLA